MAYSDAYFTARESWRDWRIEAGQLISLARVAAGARVLEIGCGGGGLLQRLQRKGVLGVGVDTLDTALHLVRRRDGSVGLVHIQDSGPLPFSAAAFEAIIGQHVLEHLDDVDGALTEWKRLLKPGGRLALATPNARYPDPAHFADAEHTCVFAPSELFAVVEGAGFKVAHLSTIFPFLSHVRLLRAAGVLAYRAFQYAPYLNTRGRTILLAGVRM